MRSVYYSHWRCGAPPLDSSAVLSVCLSVGSGACAAIDALSLNRAAHRMGNPRCMQHDTARNTARSAPCACCCSLLRRAEIAGLVRVNRLMRPKGTAHRSAGKPRHAEPSHAEPHKRTHCVASATACRCTSTPVGLTFAFALLRVPKRHRPAARSRCSTAGCKGTVRVRYSLNRGAVCR